MVRGIFKPLRASGAAGAAATKNGRRAKTVANFICIVKKRLEGCGLVKSSGEVRERNELGEPAARAVPMLESIHDLYALSVAFSGQHGKIMLALSLSRWERYTTWKVV